VSIANIAECLIVQKISRYLWKRSNSYINPYDYICDIRLYYISTWNTTDAIFKRTCSSLFTLSFQNELNAVWCTFHSNPTAMNELPGFTELTTQFTCISFNDSAYFGPHYLLNVKCKCTINHNVYMRFTFGDINICSVSLRPSVYNYHHIFDWLSFNAYNWKTGAVNDKVVHQYYNSCDSWVTINIISLKSPTTLSTFRKLYTDSFDPLWEATCHKIGLTCDCLEKKCIKGTRRIAIDYVSECINDMIVSDVLFT